MSPFLSPLGKSRTLSKVLLFYHSFLRHLGVEGIQQETDDFSEVDSVWSAIKFCLKVFPLAMMSLFPHCCLRCFHVTDFYSAPAVSIPLFPFPPSPSPQNGLESCDVGPTPRPTHPSSSCHLFPPQK